MGNLNLGRIRPKGAEVRKAEVNRAFARRVGWVTILA
jgi:hypothetical protein